VRVTFILLLLVSLAAAPVQAQVPIDLVSPEAAFAGGPIHLSPAAEARLTAQFHGGKVPLIPQPFRGRLDTALAAKDWRQVDVAKKALLTAESPALVLMWERSRFLATGEIGLATDYARDIAATDMSDGAETAAMLWLYAVAATFTDGHQCTDPAAKEAYLDRLRGPEFAAVLGIIRVLPEARLAALRDTAIRLEVALSADRADDTMCRAGSDKPSVRPEADWRPEMLTSRDMLPRHLLAICSILRAKS
jgi:hypothetical protein